MSVFTCDHRPAAAPPLLSERERAEARRWARELQRALDREARLGRFPETDERCAQIAERIRVRRAEAEDF
ncbi:MAG: hypothetical protein ACREVC_14340 [Burkholderiales bacterium]